MNVTLPFWSYCKLLWRKVSWFGDLTKPGRFYFLDLCIYVCLRRAIDVLQSMTPKRRWRILQITLVRHFIYSKNASAYSNLNSGDINGGGGGGGKGRAIWRIVRTSWKILATPLNSTARVNRIWRSYSSACNWKLFFSYLGFFECLRICKWGGH